MRSRLAVIAPLAVLSTVVVLVGCGDGSRRMPPGAAFWRSEEGQQRLEKKVFASASGESVNYRICLPRDYDPESKYSLVFFLHGAGDGGDDNAKQFFRPEVLYLVTDEVARKHPCILVAPQHGVGKGWKTELLFELLDALEKEYPIDPARRYVTGISGGGGACFQLCAHRPGYFAAAVPLSGGASAGSEVAQTAFWIFQGGDDPAPTPAQTKQMIEAMKAVGASVKYTEYPGIRHETWDYAYEEPGLVEWLFSQHNDGNQ